MAKKKWLVAGIDVGTTKICTVIAQFEQDGIHILGVGYAASNGLRRGVVVNLSEVIESVRASLDEAEKQSQTVVESAYVSVGGSYLRGLNNRGVTEVRGKGRAIDSDDIDRAISAACDLDIPEDFQTIHVLTQDFWVDNHEGILNPLGMTGRRITVNLHVVINAAAIVQNIVSAINKTGVIVSGAVMHQMASAEAILSPDEKEMGTIVIDIGGGTLDIVAYSQGSIRYSEVLPLGGNLVTKDIAVGLRAPVREAEQVKKEFGSVFPESVPAEEVIELAELGTGRRRTVTRRLLCEIIQARCDEILQAVARSIARMDVQTDLITGVVLTGGGSLMDGLVQRAEDVLSLPVRLGYPINLVPSDHHLFHPAYSTALGLLRYARDIQGEAADRFGGRESFVRRRGEAPAAERVKNWLLERIS